MSCEKNLKSIFLNYYSFQCENELKYWDGVGPGRPTEASSQLEAVLGEVRRLEEAATRNEEELERSGMGSEAGSGGGPGIRGELDQLKHRLGEIRDMRLSEGISL